MTLGTLSLSPVTRGHYCHACKSAGLHKSDMDVTMFNASHNAAMQRHFGGPVCATCTDEHVETAEDGVMKWTRCDQAGDGSWWPKQDQPMFRMWGR